MNPQLTTDSSSSSGASNVDSSNSSYPLSYIMSNIKPDLISAKQSGPKLGQLHEVDSSVILGSESSTSSGNSRTRQLNTPDNVSSSKRVKSSHQRALDQSAINEIVGDLMSLQNMIPGNDNMSPSPPMHLLSRSSQRGSSSSNLNQVNFDIDDDINSEIIDKLFNQYPFDSFQPQ